MSLTDTRMLCLRQTWPRAAHKSRRVQRGQPSVKVGRFHGIEVIEGDVLMEAAIPAKQRLLVRGLGQLMAFRGFISKSDGFNLV